MKFWMPAENVVTKLSLNQDKTFIYKVTGFTKCYRFYLFHVTVRNELFWYFLKYCC